MLLSGCAPLVSPPQAEPGSKVPTLVPFPFPTFTLEPSPTSPPAPTMPPGVTPSPTPTPTVSLETPLPLNVVIPESNEHCLAPVVAPTKPADVPMQGGLDWNTGRHMMGIPQVIDVEKYRLVVKGRVAQALSLSYDDLRCLPKMTEKVTTTCYAFADTATWSGTPLSEVLQVAGVKPGAKKVTQRSADGAERSVNLEQALDGHNFLAYEMKGHALPVLFGFPLRSIFINVAGQYSVKWLTELEVV